MLSAPVGKRLAVWAGREGVWFAQLVAAGGARGPRTVSRGSRRGICAWRRWERDLRLGPGRAMWRTVRAGCGGRRRALPAVDDGQLRAAARAMRLAPVVQRPASSV